MPAGQQDIEPAVLRTHSRSTQSDGETHGAYFERSNGGGTPVRRGLQRGRRRGHGSNVRRPDADPRPLSPHVWQGPTASEDWWSEVLAEREHLVASGLHLTLDEPRHVDVTGDFASVVAPATVTFDLGAREITQTGSLFTVALRK